MKIVQKYVKLQKTYTRIKHINSDTVGTKVISAITHNGNFLKMLFAMFKKRDRFAATAGRNLYFSKSTCL